MEIKKPYEVIQFDKLNKKIKLPHLVLKNRSLDTIGAIPKYTNWNCSLVGNGLDEITFDVAKYVDGVLCPVWDDLIDLKIVEVSGYGCFEISVDYTDNTKTVKSIHGVSLETELGQLLLYEFHINDDEDIEREDYKPTVFFNPNDTKHSLLHRALADKAPHWSFDYVTPYIALDENYQPELSSAFQRTYTEDGTSIYDFLTGTVAEESNVIFVFNTFERKISVYNLCDCIDQKKREILAHAIGEDTTIFVSKEKLANEITISSNKDEVKNCFRIEGGDDVITDLVRAVNINGSNYIYQFADFQYNDMPDELVEKIKTYQEKISSKEVQDEYYGENGIYTQLCNAYDELLYYESSMMPDVSLEETNAETQYWNVVNQLDRTKANSIDIGMYYLNTYTNNAFDGITNSVEALASILVDSRYEVEIIKDSVSYDSQNHIWTGNIQVKRVTDETDYFPKTADDINTYFSVNVTDDEETYVKQKLEKELAKGSMLNIDFTIDNFNAEQMKEYFNLYSLNRLNSFYSGYDSCISILASMNNTSTPDVVNEIYDIYIERRNIVEEIKNKRQKEVDSINSKIKSIEQKQRDFQTKWNFVNGEYGIGEDLYKVFCAYIREDTYQNNNYISDGYETNTTKLLDACKQLLDAANKEIKKSCVLQRTISTSLNNLFAIPEFEPLYDKFALYNYIRIRTEDEILKLRLIGVDFNGESVNEISVTFAEQIESVDGKISDTQSILQQASAIATNFSSTALQAKQGSEAKSIFAEMYAKGLNTSKTMLTNNDHNEVTVTSSGILCRRMDDEGYYGNKQFRITGNIAAFTKDNWQTVEMAIGETSFINPITGEEKTDYGIIAPNLVGQLIAGENLYIGNEKGSVIITGEGIQLDGGTITWTSPIQQDAVEGLNDTLNTFVEKVTYNQDISQLQDQIDGNITTWFYDGEPTLDNNPASNWETDKDKNIHLGDLYYDNQTGYAYRFQLADSIYSWIKITDTDVTKALTDAAKAQDIANDKRRVFIEQPVPPYDVGDLWVQGDGKENHAISLSATIYSDYIKCGNTLEITSLSITESGSNGSITCYLYDEDKNEISNIKKITKPIIINTSNATYIRLLYVFASGRVANMTYIITSKIGGDILKCVTAKSDQESYGENDWALASKYTDDSALNSYKEEISLFQTKVNTALMGSATTEIGSDYIISPKIGGGYLYITKNDYPSVEINPVGDEYDYDGKSGYIFRISDSSDHTIMGVDGDGNGYFKGTIEADSGYFKGTIESSSDTSVVQIYAGGIFLNNINEDNSYSKIGHIAKTTLLNSTGQVQGVGFALDENGSFFAFSDKNLNPLVVFDFDGKVTGYANTIVSDNALIIDSNLGSDHSKPYCSLYSKGRIYSAGAICPSVDNQIALGVPEYRWTNVFATGVITTSDENEKDILSDIPDSYENAFMELNPILFKYKNFKSEDDEQHIHDRIHCGFSAQETEKVFKKYGITSDEFALVCKDEFDKTLLNGTNERYGMKYENLHGLEVHMIQKLIKKVKELEDKLTELKGRT